MRKELMREVRGMGMHTRRPDGSDAYEEVWCQRRHGGQLPHSGHERAWVLWRLCLWEAWFKILYFKTYINLLKFVYSITRFDLTPWPQSRGTLSLIRILNVSTSFRYISIYSSFSLHNFMRFFWNVFLKTIWNKIIFLG